MPSELSRRVFASESETVRQPGEQLWSHDGDVADPDGHAAVAGQVLTTRP
jgi:hypothetical protein